MWNCLEILLRSFFTYTSPGVRQEKQTKMDSSISQESLWQFAFMDQVHSDQSISQTSWLVRTNHVSAHFSRPLIRLAWDVRSSAALSCWCPRGWGRTAPPGLRRTACRPPGWAAETCNWRRRPRRTSWQTSPLHLETAGKHTQDYHPVVGQNIILLL